MEELLRVDSVVVSFGRQEVLKSASLWARSGEITVLLGRNGSGKSTLLKVAAGVLRPSWGVTWYRGRHHRRPRLARLAREGLMFVPQEGVLTLSHTPRVHLESVTRAFGSGDAREAVESLLLEELLDRDPGTLSGGEWNRFNTGLAVARQPLCLLIDEPLTGAAPLDRERITEALRRLADRGTAVVVTGHEAHLLMAFAHRVLWLVSGTTHDLGTPEEADGHHQFRREYLGPVTTGERRKGPAWEGV